MCIRDSSPPLRMPQNRMRSAHDIGSAAGSSLGPWRQQQEAVQQAPASTKPTKAEAKKHRRGARPRAFLSVRAGEPVG
eukprot:10051197-Alexandrium_andersonii.AAC.1